MVKRLRIDEKASWMNEIPNMEKIEQDLLYWVVKWLGLENVDEYKLMLLNAFLLFLGKEKKRLEIVLNRWKRVVEGNFTPRSREEWIELFLGYEEKALTFSEGDLDKELEGLRALEKKLQNELNEVKKELRLGFNDFWKKNEKELILSGRTVFSDELEDKEMENEALRWEYRYTSISDKKRKRIREEYIKRQNECFNLN